MGPPRHLLAPLNSFHPFRPRVIGLSNYRVGGFTVIKKGYEIIALTFNLGVLILGNLSRVRSVAVTNLERAPPG